MPSEPRRQGLSSHDEVIALLTRARDADPRGNPFGVLVQDPWEDGEQQFFWYPTRDALEHALLDAHAFVDPGAYAEDQDDWHEARFDLDHALRDLRELRPEEAEALDDLVNDFFCIVWIGQLEDLLAGDDPLALNLREELRWGTGDGHDDSSPVADGELDAFVELLREFGIDEDARD